MARAEERPLDAKGWVVLGSLTAVMGYFAVTGNPIPTEGWRSLKVYGWQAHLVYGALAAAPAYVLTLNVVVLLRARGR